MRSFIRKIGLRELGVRRTRITLRCQVRLARSALDRNSGQVLFFDFLGFNQLVSLRRTDQLFGINIIGVNQREESLLGGGFIRPLTVPLLATYQLPARDSSTGAQHIGGCFANDRHPILNQLQLIQADAQV